jgi:ribosomal protein S3
MGQKVSPNVLRIGIIRTWENRWFAEKGEYVKWLHQDIKIKNTLKKQLNSGFVSKDYALYEAKTTYGQIGVKVWINHGEILGKDKHDSKKTVEEKRSVKGAK